MASKRRLRRKACEGKQQHSTKEEAAAHAGNHRRRFNDPLAVYHCKFGDHWHIGHRDAKKRQSEAARKRAKYS